MGKLKDKTRILVTHAIDFLSVSDSIILLEKGKVVFKGHYDEVKDNEYLKKLMKIHQQQKEEAKGEDSEEEEVDSEDSLTDELEDQVDDVIIAQEE